MSFEKFESKDHTESLDHKALRVRNEIQISIMSHTCSPDEGEECFDNWIDENGEKFNTVFDRVLSKDPGILNKWDNNPTFYTELFMSELEDSQVRKAA